MSFLFLFFNVFSIKKKKLSVMKKKLSSLCTGQQILLSITSIYLIYPLVNCNIYTYYYII